MKLRRVGLSLLGLSLIGGAVFIWSGSGPTRPNIVLLTIDTLRADHLMPYGYERHTSPVMAKMAKQGVLFEHAIAQAPWTLASMATVHSSLLPSVHGAQGAKTRLPDSVVTVAEALSGIGYHTIGLVSHYFVGRDHGFAQGFAHFDETQIRGHDAVTSQALTGRALDYLGKHHQKPFFLWIHYFDPHFTYVRHCQFDLVPAYQGSLPEKLSAQLLNGLIAETSPRTLSHEDLEYIQGVYDEEIAYNDHWVGVLLDGLEKLGLGQSSVVILTSDHGEYFMERGRFFHGKDVYDALVHVPLIITGSIAPDLRGGRVPQSVALASLPRTIMALALETRSTFGGTDLLSLATPQSKVQPGSVMSEGSYAWGSDQRKVAVIEQHWKLIWNFDDNTYELYHLAVDKNERHNRIDDPSSQVQRIRQDLLAKLKRFGEKRAQTIDETVEISADKREHLRSLGYVE